MEPCQPVPPAVGELNAEGYASARSRRGTARRVWFDRPSHPRGPAECPRPLPDSPGAPIRGSRRARHQERRQCSCPAAGQILELRQALRFQRKSVHGLRQYPMSSFHRDREEIFSVVNSLLLRTLPVEDPERLAILGDAIRPSPSWSEPVWEQIRIRPELFDGALAWSSERLNLARGGEAQFVDGVWVSGEFFDVLGVQAALGRTFARRDDHHGQRRESGLVRHLRHASACRTRLRADGSAGDTAGCRRERIVRPAVLQGYEPRRPRRRRRRQPFRDRRSGRGCRVSIRARSGPSDALHVRDAARGRTAVCQNQRARGDRPGRALASTASPRTRCPAERQRLACASHSARPGRAWSGW